MATAKKIEGAPRRVPTQERSKRRYEAILDAAGAVFAEVGVEAAAMETIAARASTSIGSVYAFFPNKIALFEALAERCNDQARRAFEQVFADISKPWTALLDAAVDTYADLQHDASFRAISLNMHLYGVIAKSDAALHRGFVDRIEALLALKAPEVPPAKRRIVAFLVVNGVSVLLHLADRDRRRAAMIDEIKVMMRRYLEPYAG